MSDYTKDKETNNVNALKHQVVEWRRLAIRFLPETDCDRDDTSAIADLIQKLQHENIELVQKAQRCEELEKISKAVIDCLVFDNKSIPKLTRKMIERLEKEVYK